MKLLTDGNHIAVPEVLGPNESTPFDFRVLSAEQVRRAMGATWVDSSPACDGYSRVSPATLRRITEGLQRYWGAPTE